VCRVTVSSPFLDLPGAVPADGIDAGVAAHYGDPFREQRELVGGTGVVDLSQRGVVRVSGSDRLGWLHSLTTHYLEGLPPYQRITTLILSPQGHVEHAMSGYDDGEAFWAHVEPGEAPDLVGWLQSMRFMMRVAVDDVTEDWAAVAFGPEVIDLVPRSELGDAIRAKPVGMWAFEALRVARGEPRFGLDTDHRTIPNEMGWLGSAVHLDKGCYRGQETVARVHTLGPPPRRLVRLLLDGSVDRLPEHGSAVVHDGRPVGFVGSVGRHYELGPVALALVKRGVPVDAELLADGVAAAQELLVDPEAGLHVRARL
jgi:tRNA-modifying protein YgfZ